MSEPPKNKRARTEEPKDDLTIGRPQYQPESGVYMTDGGSVEVHRNVERVKESEIDESIEALVSSLDEHRGCIFESAYEYPGRYAKWTFGFSNPPLCISSVDRMVTIEALNHRGRVLVSALHACLEKQECLENFKIHDFGKVSYKVKEPVKHFSEEERSKQNSVFSIVRAIVEFFGSEQDPQLGLYGAFGYDLTFQFNKVKMKHDRSNDNQRDLLLYLPDEVLVYDKQAKSAWKIQYEFTIVGSGGSTIGLERTGASVPFVPRQTLDVQRDHKPGEYAESVKKAKEQFVKGNLFEAVLSQTFSRPCKAKPSELFQRLRKKNPSPYMFVINLGESEYLVGASPEMFVRCETTSQGKRIETCPISGTIRRGKDAMEDAQRIREILVNRKEESELTMCTDVDRNDKSRICRAGSIQVIGRRQIELYSKLIHTVDHVEGYLREGFDALDAFLCHTWAVTVTGAPKLWAIQFVEDNEKSRRCWYGAAVGLIGFDGNLNTGLTLRTIRIKDGVAQVRAGATLLFDSDPELEEKETELKASAFLEVLEEGPSKEKPERTRPSNPLRVGVGNGKNVVIIDHEDSFVHTLANYFRQTGATVTVMRRGPFFAWAESSWPAEKPDLAVMSPGPGCPKDFECSKTISMLLKHKVPIFGVCLGMQAIIEHFGGKLGVLSYPQHGKPAKIKVAGGKVLSGLGSEFQVGRYHSLFGMKDEWPQKELLETAFVVDSGVHVPMALEHATLPIGAVQFHPESIMTSHSIGLTIAANALSNLKY